MAHHLFPHLVCYDISDPRRLRRVHQTLCHWGLPFQSSVFHVMLSHHARERLAAILRSTIDERADDIRIYGMPRGGIITYQGDSPVYPGLYLEDLILRPALSIARWKFRTRLPG